LQEFSGARTSFTDHHNIININKDHYDTTNGHVVFVSPPCLGCRATAIVVHKDLTHTIIMESFRHRPRVCSVALHWEGYNILLVSAHLPQRQHSNMDYTTSIGDTMDILNKRQARHYFGKYGKHSSEINLKPVYTILGVDAQHELGKVEDYDDPNIVGE
jgi:hypothetical protein